MPKAQVLVTVAAEALVRVPDDVADVEAYCRERVSLDWGDLPVEAILQSPSVAVEHFVVPEPEPPAAESAPEAAPRAVASPGAGGHAASSALFDDAAYREIARAAVRARAARLLEEVVEQVLDELEPLIRRRLDQDPRQEP